MEVVEHREQTLLCPTKTLLAYFAIAETFQLRKKSLVDPSGLPKRNGTPHLQVAKVENTDLEDL